MPRKTATKTNSKGIVKRGSKYAFTYYDPTTGKKKWVSGFATWSEANSAKLEVEREKRETGSVTPVNRGKETLSTYLESWLAGRVTLKPTTIRQYGQSIQKINAVMGDLELRHVDAVRIEAMQRQFLSEGLSARSVQLHLSVLGKALVDATRKKMLRENPMAMVERVTPDERPVEALTKQQAEAILAAAEGTLWEPLVYLAYVTGARRGEVMAAKWQHFDLDAGTWTVQENVTQIGQERKIGTPKSGRIRTVSLTEATVTYLRRRKAQQAQQQLAHPAWVQTDLVVCNPDGSAPLPDSATQAFRRIAKKARVEGAHLHMLRHTHATMLADAGLPMAALSQRLGHASTAVTEAVYVGRLHQSEEQARLLTQQALGL